MNARTRERPNLIEHVTFRGDEYLFYPALPLDVVIVRGTHADEDGNLTTDEEVMKLEVLHAVLAARRFGAKVLAQVKYRVAKGSLHPKSITVPGNLIDAIVVCEEPQTDHRQTSSWAFDPALCGDIQLPAAQNAPLPLDLRKLIGRIACRYLTPGCVINLGTGIPNDVIGAIIHEEQLGEQVTITVESGIYGGQQAGGVDFGIGRNLSAMISHRGSNALLQRRRSRHHLYGRRRDGPARARQCHTARRILPRRGRFYRYHPECPPRRVLLLFLPPRGWRSPVNTGRCISAAKAKCVNSSPG